MGKADATSALAAAIGAPLPAGLEKLNTEQAQVLTKALADAGARQRADLKVASDAALSHIPLLLRGTVRKVLFG